MMLSKAEMFGVVGSFVIWLDMELAGLLVGMLGVVGNFGIWLDIDLAEVLLGMLGVVGSFGIWLDMDLAGLLVWMFGTVGSFTICPAVDLAWLVLGAVFSLTWPELDLAGLGGGVGWAEAGLFFTVFCPYTGDTELCRPELAGLAGAGD